MLRQATAPAPALALVAAYPLHLLGQARLIGMGTDQRRQHCCPASKPESAFMVTVTKEWHRWCGPRSDLIRAIELAAATLQTWTGLNSDVRVSVEEAGGLVESGPDLDMITSRHSGELRHLQRITVTVKPSQDAWEQAFRVAGEQGRPRPDISAAEVLIRVTQHGTSFQVEGDDRTGVEGLAQRLEDTLGRATTNFPGFERGWIPVPSGVVLPLGAFLGYLVSRWLGLASQNARLESAEIIGPILGGLLTAALLAGGWWLFPPMELFDEGGVGRARRFRGWAIGALGVLVGGIVAAFLYDQVK